MQGIIAEDVAFGVLHGPIDLPLVSSKYAVRADPPTKIEPMPAALISQDSALISMH
jgi:hypothetical protein